MTLASSLQRPSTAAPVATAETKAHRPWYREPLVWMVIGGPASVVVASLVTAVVAWKHIDPVITDPVTGQVTHAGDDVADYRKPSDVTAPAQVARNHAATPRP